MKHRFIKLLGILTILLTGLIAFPINSYAGTCSTSGSSTAISIGCLPDVPANHNTIAILLNIAFGIIGAIAVIVIVMAGIRFTMSRGRPEEVARAKDTIIYAAVGLIVCIMAVSIVSFVAGYI
ncbi:MAG TPA: hypothetical protein VMR76_03140 [Candidatus Saccharimonadia bacterium]|nr:hypothetical protein [Candidatus Saccharimonadia bacterium]